MRNGFIPSRLASRGWQIYQYIVGITKGFHMRKLMSVLLSVAMVLSGYAVGDTLSVTGSQAKVSKAKKCLFPKSRKRAPAWVCDAHADGLAVAAMGSAVKSKAGLAHMEQMAAADARAQLVRSLRRAERKNSASSANAANGDAAEISEETLTGAKIIKRAYAPNGTLYVLMGLDETEAQKLREAIKASELGQRSKE